MPASEVEFRVTEVGHSLSFLHLKLLKETVVDYITL